MNYQNTAILINPVENGFVLTLPSNEEDYYLQQQKAIIDHALIETGQKDKMLSGQQKEQSGLQKMPNVFIFDSFEKVLSFLANKYV